MDKLDKPKLLKKGAEATIYFSNWYGKEIVIKSRNVKNYRHPKFASPYDYSDANCPVAEEASQDSFMIPHPMLLGNKEETDLIIEAIVKLQKNSKEL